MTPQYRDTLPPKQVKTALKSVQTNKTNTLSVVILAWLPTFWLTTILYTSIFFFPRIEISRVQYRILGHPTHQRNWQPTKPYLVEWNRIAINLVSSQTLETAVSSHVSFIFLDSSSSPVMNWKHWILWSKLGDIMYQKIDYVIVNLTNIFLKRGNRNQNVIFKWNKCKKKKNEIKTYKHFQSIGPN